MRPAGSRIAIAATLALLALPAPGHASGGPGEPALGNGSHPLESRAFSSCQRFAARRASCVRGARSYQGALETFS